MTPERWQQIDRLLELALERQPSERAELLVKACAGDEELRREVESLMLAHEQAGSFIDVPARQTAEQPTPTTHGRLAMGQQLGSYKILSLLGAGGMGEVYLAEDSRLGRKVALKLLPEHFTQDRERLRRFEREARAVSALNHPNILIIHEIGEHLGSTFIATEFIDGETLRLKMTDRPLELREALDIAVQVMGALAAAHEAGVVHRDIKPENIMLRPDGYVKVLDFGLAKLIDSPTPKTQEPTRGLSGTETGMVMGTTRYMSPEQARGLKVDARTDIFSLGVVIYETITGRAPFEGETATDVIIAIVQKEPLPLSILCAEVPSELEQIVSRSLTKDREQRYQTAKELQTDLKRLKQRLELEAELERTAGDEGKAGERGKVQGESTPKKAEAQRSDFVLRLARSTSIRRRLRFVAGLAVLLVAIGLARFWWRSTSQPAEVRLQQLTFNPTEDPIDGASAISPDGKYLAYWDHSGLCLSIVQTRETHSLFKPEGRIVDLSWFPDGTRLLARGFWQATINSLTVVSILGGSPRKLRDNVGSACSVSPDGSLIAFTTDDDREIWSMGANGEEPVKVISLPEGYLFMSVNWSPSGQRLAYVKVHPLPAGKESSIESCDLNGGQVALILSDPRLPMDSPGLPMAGICAFCWTSDSRIIFPLTDPTSTRVAAGNLWEIKVDPKTGKALSGPRQITRWPDFNFLQASVTADGKRLAFKKWDFQADVYVAELEANGKRLKTPRRLTLSNRLDFPASWTPDSKAVLFRSNRNGHFDIFKQDISQTAVEPLVVSQEKKREARLSPDGSWILYRIEPAPGSPQEDRLMRLPIGGGPPQLILKGKDITSFSCARSPSTLCVFLQRIERQLIFSAFDPLKGQGPALFRLELEPQIGDWLYWNLSPDGSHIALQGSAQSGGLVRILSLKGELLKEIPVEDVDSVDAISWSVDGKGMYVTATYHSNDVELLYVGMDGKIEVLWQGLGHAWAPGETFPSPDGRYLAIQGNMWDANVWMIENF